MLGGQFEHNYYSQVLPSNATGRFRSSPEQQEERHDAEAGGQQISEVKVIDEEATNAKIQVVVSQYEMVLAQLNSQVQNLLMQN